MTTLNNATQKQLRQFVEQLERLDEEKQQLASDIRDKYLEAKAVGFDVKALRKVIAARKKSKEERDEEEAIFDVYCHALGMAGTPMGDYIDKNDPMTQQIAKAHGISLEA